MVTTALGSVCPKTPAGILKLSPEVPPTCWDVTSVRTERPVLIAPLSEERPLPVPPPAPAFVPEFDGPTLIRDD
jgi:hypothetical protein